MRAILALLTVVLASAIAPPAGAQTYYNELGRWEWVDAAQWDKMNGTTLESGGGTNLALLRGNADSSWVLLLAGEVAGGRRT